MKHPVYKYFNHIRQLTTLMVILKSLYNIFDKIRRLACLYSFLTGGAGFVLGVMAAIYAIIVFVLRCYHYGDPHKQFAFMLKAINSILTTPLVYSAITLRLDGEDISELYAALSFALF